MTIQWPVFIGLFLLIPLLIAFYIWLLRRRRRVVVRYSSLSLVRAALPRQSQIRRHIPFALFLLGLAALIFALMRPVAVMAVPTDQTTILLAIDVSRSMCSTDVDPSRILAAEDAALNFVRNQKGSLIGVVAFSGFAELIQEPTHDTAALESAIQSLATGPRTAIGSGLLKSLDAIAEVDPSIQASTTSKDLEPAPVPKGAYAPDIIVLLTDGVSNTGPLPLDAAQQAATRGIRVYTIGFGTAAGLEFPRCPSQLLSADPFGPRGQGGRQFGNGQQGGGFGGGGFGGPNGNFRRGIDEDTLKQVADMTGGAYYSAESASQLLDVFQNLPTNLIIRHETLEISAIFAGIGAVSLALAILFSLLWNP
jgi:Ca-activated chloride channel family protein